MQLNKFLRQIVALIAMASLAILSTPSFGSPINQDFEAVRVLLLKLGSADKKQSSAAAEALGGYSYAEVIKALINKALTELSLTPPNSFVVGNSINSLKKLATQNDIEELEKIKFQIEKLIGKGASNRSFTYILSSVEEAIQEAAQREISSLQSLIPPKAKQSSSDVTGSLSKKRTLKQELDERMMSGGGELTVEDINEFYIATSSFLSDEILEQIRKDEQFEIYGRDKEAQAAIDTLTREKGKNPILVGPRGAGKTTIVQKVARIILEDQLPGHAVFQNELAGAFMIETTPARISRLAKANDNNSQAAAVEKYFDVILKIERAMGLKIIIFIDEIHTFGPGQVEALKPYLDSRTRAIKLIGASTSVEYQNAFKSNPAIQRRFDTIGVSEQSVEEVKKIIMASEKARTEKRYGFKVSEEAIDTIVHNANRVYPDTSLVDASAKMLMTLCSAEARKLENKNVAQSLGVTESMVYGFIQNKLGYPVNPLDAKAMQKYKEDLLAFLNEEVLGQEGMVGDVANEWIRLLKNSRKGVRTVAILGPTGVGKSQLGMALAKKVFGSAGAFLKVDGNQFKEGGFSSNTFFGAPNGVSSSDKTAGMLFDYLDDPGKGKFGGVIMIDEAERAHTDFWEKMMEIIDTGRATGGDGKERTLSRHLIILTSNRGDSILFPKTIEDWTDSEFRDHLQSLTEERLKAAFQEATSGKDEFKLPNAILARIDKYTAAAPMVRALVRMIAIQKTQRAMRQIEGTYKIKVELDDKVPTKIADVAYQKGLGARPVEKAAVDLVESAVDHYLVQNVVRRGDVIRISLGQDDDHSQIDVQGPGGLSSAKIPTAAKSDLLNDQEFLARLNSLESELKVKIFGQDEMIGRIKDAVIAHQATQGKRPLSLFIVGTTGTGKTETAKALARSLYRSESRILVLDLGKILYEGEFNNIFGSPAGHLGSLREYPFETFLKENPQGGVIVFDEISNMGGKNVDKKEELFKKLYSIFEEGSWTSPATSKTYDLSKYTILSTGNDLEKLLQGISADDLRLAIWNKNKSSSNVRTILRRSGVPEAFLGRMADIILTKPLLKSEVVRVTLKILGEQTQEFRAKNLEIKFDESFIQDVSNKFFTQDQGARSIRNLIEFRVKSAITQLVIRANGIANLHGKTVYLSVADNQVDRTYIRSSDPERSVILKATLDPKDANSLTVTLDATEFVSKINLQTKKELLRTAYHEAGHAAVNNPSATGESMAMITVIGQDEYLGYARYDEIRGQAQAQTEQRTTSQLARLLAGQIAERLAGFQQSAGWRNDLEKARRLATDYILEWGMGENMAALQIDEKGKPKLSPAKALQFQIEMDRLFMAAQTQAETVLKSKWKFVRDVVGELFAKGQISGERFTQIEALHKNAHVILPSAKGKNFDKVTSPMTSADRCMKLLGGG